MDTFCAKTRGGDELCEDTEFLCEYRLKELDEDLHRCYRNSIFVIDRLLTNYKLVFPFSRTTPLNIPLRSSITAMPCSAGRMRRA